MCQRAGGDITGLAFGYYLGAILMIAGGVVEIFLRVKAEGQSLESIAQPRTAEDEASGSEEEDDDRVKALPEADGLGVRTAESVLSAV